MISVVSAVQPAESRSFSTNAAILMMTRQDPAARAAALGRRGGIRVGA